VTETHELPVDVGALRAEVREKYRAVADATGEEKACTFDVYGYAFLARRP
jgi:hypothetical protein